MKSYKIVFDYGLLCRVAYRQHLQDLKEEKRKEEEERIAEEERERERRLDALREQVYL